MRKRNQWKSRMVIFLTGLMVCAAVCCMKVPSAKADNSNYGVDAYYYMNYIQTNFPGRVVGTPMEKAMEQWLIQEVTAMGYAPYTFFTEWDQDGIHYEGDVILFEKPGNTGRRIVVGAHYDSVDTNGADDNASGVGLLLETAKRMIDVPTQYTIQFALFSIEEPGCMGSQYYVSRETQEYRDSVAVMINLDTIAAGDHMYIYGGGIDDQGNLVRTWGAEQALATAKDMGLNMSFHPDVNEKYPVPVKNTASDHMAYDFHNIPYIYFEASNWNGGNFTNFYQTADSRVPDGKMMHTWMDNLDFYNETFPGRVQNHLTSYSMLLDRLLRGLVEGSSASIIPKMQYTEVSETVYAVSNVNIRSGAGTSFSVLDVLEAGEALERTGYHEEWSRVSYQGTTGYIASSYLTTEEPETEPPATEEETTLEETAAETSMEETTGEEIATEAASEESISIEETGAEATDEYSEEDSTSDDAAGIQDADRSNTWIWIAGIGGAAVVVLAGFVIYKIWDSKKRQS